MILVRTMGFIAAMVVGSISMAANVVPDGTYAGTGSWSTDTTSGHLAGSMDMTWVQNGPIGLNSSALKLGSSVVQTFSDEYKFNEGTSHHYALSRLIGSAYQLVGTGTMSGDSYTTTFAQDAYTATELGYMQDADTLVRIGTLTAADGTVTFYRATLVRQP